MLSEQLTVAGTNHFVSTRWQVVVAQHRVVVAQHSAASVPLPVEPPPLPNASFTLGASLHPPGTVNIHQHLPLTSLGEFVVLKASIHARVPPTINMLKTYQITHNPNSSVSLRQFIAQEV